MSLGEGILGSGRIMEVLSITTNAPAESWWPSPPSQSLNTVSELVAWLIAARADGGGTCPWGPKAIAAPAYADLVASMWSASGSAVSPNAFLRRIAKASGFMANADSHTRVCSCIPRLWWSSLPLPRASACLTPQPLPRLATQVDSRWGDGSQQDSQEFLHSLLEALQSETNRVSGKPVYKELTGKGSVEAQVSR